MALGRPPYLRYRKDLKAKARNLRRELTPPERKLWFDYLARHAMKFTRQKPLARYIADFYCAQKKLVIEVDGDSHFTDGGARYDATRAGELARLGVRILRFTNSEVMCEFEGVCERIEQALAEGA